MGGGVKPSHTQKRRKRGQQPEIDSSGGGSPASKKVKKQVCGQKKDEVVGEGAKQENYRNLYGGQTMGRGKRAADRPDLDKRGGQASS